MCVECGIQTFVLWIEDTRHFMWKNINLFWWWKCYRALVCILFDVDIISDQVLVLWWSSVFFVLFEGNQWLVGKFFIWWMVTTYPVHCTYSYKFKKKVKKCSHKHLMFLIRLHSQTHSTENAFVYFYICQRKRFTCKIYRRQNCSAFHFVLC